MAVIPSLLLSFLSLLFVMRSEASNSQLSFVYHECVDTGGNMSSTYEDNRNTVLDKLTSGKEIDNGFYNLSFGQNPDKVNALGLCRGDVKPDDCRACLDKSATLLTERCRSEKEAIGWFDKCMLRYSNTSIFGVLVNYPDNVLCNENTTTVSQFNQVVDNLLHRLMNSTVNASSDPHRKFAEDSAPVPSSNDTIHALVQCRPDLSNKNCTECLDGAFSQINSNCYGTRGGQYVGPSCTVRYEAYVFFNALAEAPQPASANTTIGEGKSNSARIVVAIVVPVVALLVLLILVCIYLRVRKARKHIESEEEEAANEIKNSELLQFDLKTISSATQHFSVENKLGQGGFGTVYKGRLSIGLSTEQEVAIKRLSKKSGQEDIVFKNEVSLTAKLQHRNLVKLLGFCLERTERLLIYEFVPNKSLDYFIFDPIKRTQLDWIRRYKIIGGIARGLLYLHQDSRSQVIHRDLKTSNILLDEEFNPKISDFGMARLFDDNQTQGITNTVVGTYGYMAPEYIKHGDFSVKSDVFSFGVMVLEIVSSQKSSAIQNGENIRDLLSFAWKNWMENTALNIVDPALKSGSTEEIMNCIKISLHCVQENKEDRPTMDFIVQMLNSKTVPLGDPSEPAFFMRGKSLSAIPSAEKNSKATTSTDSGSQSVEGSNYRPPISDICPR